MQNSIQVGYQDQKEKKNKNAIAIWKFQAHGKSVVVAEGMDELNQFSVFIRSLKSLLFLFYKNSPLVVICC
jgi:hypothetical protein